MNNFPEIKKEYFCLQQNVNRKCPVTKQEPIWTIGCDTCPSIIQKEKLKSLSTISILIGVMRGKKY
jgi:hypothetical protein